MGRLNGRPARERAALVLKIAAAGLLALAVAAGCAALIVLFIRTGFLPGGVRFAVIALCVLLIVADFFILRGWTVVRLAGGAPPAEPESTAGSKDTAEPENPAQPQ